MGILTREEKMDMETGKFEVTKKGLFKGSRTPAYDKLKPQIKAKQQLINKAKWNKRAKTAKRTVKTINKALDWLEGKPPVKQRKRSHKPKTKFIIKNGMAYPVYTHPRPKQGKKQIKIPVKKKLTYDAFDFKL